MLRSTHKDEKVPQTMEANNIGQRIRKLRGVNEGTKSVENATSDEVMDFFGRERVTQGAPEEQTDPSLKDI